MQTDPGHPMSSRPRLTKKPFTMIELLVVIAVIGILASLLLPALAKSKYKAKLILCLNNQKEIGLGLTMYADDFDSWFPAVTCPLGSDCTGATNKHHTVEGNEVRNSTTSVKQWDYGYRHWNIMDDDNMAYYGGWHAAKQIFMCPIAEPLYTSSYNNYDKIFPYKMSGGDKRYIPYALFFNWGGGGIGAVSKSMNRLGQSWKLGTGGKVMPASKNMESDLLIGDVVQYWGSGETRANHYEWGSGSTGKTSQPACYRLPQPTNGNFLRQDLSGGLSKGLHHLFPNTTGGIADRYNPIFPLEHLK